MLFRSQRISTHAVENSLVNQTVSDAIAWTYQLEGHDVYVVTFPSIGTNGLTWAFDVSTGLWHKWMWTNNQGQFERHRGNCAAVFQGMVLVGDYANGNIYELDQSNYTDAGQNVRRLRRAPHLVADLQREYFSELQIQFQPGVGTTGLIVNAPNENVSASNPLVIAPTAQVIINPYESLVIGLQNQINTQTTTTYRSEEHTSEL